MAIIDDDLKATVRLILGETETSLPDATIENPAIGGASEAYVLARIGLPPYEDRSPEDQEKIRTALAYVIAAKILDTGAYRSRWATTSEKFADQYSVTKAGGSLDLPGWKSRLWSDADGILDGLNPRLSKPHFRLAPGRRGA